MKTACLIPAFNEEERILRTIDAVKAIEKVDEVIVIDDGSSDKTRAIAETAQVVVVSLPSNQGKGAALNAGWKKTNADVLLLLDADLGDTARLGGELLEPIFKGEADMSIARFSYGQTVQGSKAMGFGFVRRFASWAIWVLTRQKFSSPLSGQRAIRAKVLDAVGGFMEGFGVEVGLTVRAARAGFRITEIPLPMRHRAYGRGLRGFIHRGRQFVMICRALWKCLREESQ